MAQVYTKQARKSVKGAVFAPGKNASGYMIFKLCENYNGKVRGGIEKTWRFTNEKLTLEQAKEIFQSKLGYKIYDEV
jgi:hypothetical protein